MNRINLPSRCHPRRNRADPVSTVVSPRLVADNANALAGGMAAKAGARTAIMAASGAAVLLSGPATADRKLLPQATIVAVTAAVISAAATPCAKNGAAGPENISAP